MSDMKPVGDDGALIDLVGVADQHFSRSAQALNDIINEIRAGDLGRAKDAAGILGTLEKALNVAFAERTRVEKLRRQDAGIVHDYALDFDVARGEIGRRLARLRAAGSGGGVS